MYKASEPVVEERPAEAEQASQTAQPTQAAQETQEAPKPAPSIPMPITVIVNNRPIVLKGKSSYVYVDVFEYIDFDLSKPQGTIVTTLNGRPAQYMENLQNGDRIEIYWRN